MKIAYDTSILGLGYINPKARTGIYRVVESLFLELIKCQEIELSLLAFHQYSSILDEQNTFLYLDSQHPQLLAQFEFCYKSQLKLEKYYQNATQIQKQLIELGLNKHSVFYKSALLWQMAVKLLAKIDTKQKFTQTKFNIYHSLFYPLPTVEVPRVLTIYDMLPILIPETFTSSICRKFNKTINSINPQKDWIICISENTKQDICEHLKINPERVFVTPLAAKTSFYPVTQPEITNNTLQCYQIPNTPYLLSLCTLEPRKNLSFLIRCFSKLIQENPNLDINLVLVGVRGWKNTEIFQVAQQNPLLKSRIIFTGYVPDEDLSAIYSGATAFVYPSLYEGFGLPPLEAMQCGTPVITSNTSSLPEVVGEAGIMLNPQKEDDLCQVILQVINDSQLRANLSQKGIQRAKQFSWKKCAEQTVQVYRTAMDYKL